jgi:hypothetical protein
VNEQQARNLLREWLRLHGDVERFQRALAALSTVQEVRSSAADQLGRLAFDAHKRFVALEAKLVGLLTLSPDLLSSDGDFALPPTDPQM